jgi:hypothetical protein
MRGEFGAYSGEWYGALRGLMLASSLIGSGASQPGLGERLRGLARRASRPKRTRFGRRGGVWGRAAEIIMISSRAAYRAWRRARALWSSPARLVLREFLMAFRMALHCLRTSKVLTAWRQRPGRVPRRSPSMIALT